MYLYIYIHESVYSSCILTPLQELLFVCLQYKVEEHVPKLRTFRSELRMLDDDDTDYDAPDWASLVPKQRLHGTPRVAQLSSAAGGNVQHYSTEQHQETLESRTARVLQVTKRETMTASSSVVDGSESSAMFRSSSETASSRPDRGDRAPSSPSKRKAELSSASPSYVTSSRDDVMKQRHHNVQTVLLRQSSSHGHYNASSLGTSNLNMSLYDAIESGVYVVTRGVFVDPFSGEVMTLKQAAARKAINDNVREIVHPISKQRMTLRAAMLNTSLIDSDQGLFHNPKTKKSYTLQEAVDMGYIIKGASLQTIYTEGGLDEQGRVSDKSGRKMTLLEAMEHGFLDTDIKCILDPRTNEYLSLTEARARGLINEHGQFVNPATGQPISIHTAVSHGITRLATQRVQLASKCVLDTASNETITFVEAVTRGCIDLGNGCYVDTRHGKQMALESAARHEFVDPELANQLGLESGLRDARGRMLTVMEAFQTGAVDVHTGRIYDVSTGQTMTIQEAVKAGYIWFRLSFFFQTKSRY